MIDEEIPIDSELGKKIGFTSDLFKGYLWIKGNDIFISAIASIHEGKGNLTNLFNKIEELGYTIKIPVPLGKMTSILINKGFIKKIENCELRGKVDVWQRG